VEESRRRKRKKSWARISNCEEERRKESESEENKKEDENEEGSRKMTEEESERAVVEEHCSERRWRQGKSTDMALGRGRKKVKKRMRKRTA